MRKTRNLHVALLILLLALAFEAYAQGQGPGSVDRIRRELERTDQMIERASEAVRASQSALARQALENAIEIQQGAWETFRKGTVEGYKAAALQTRMARQQAKKALSNARVTQENENSVQRRLERAAEYLDRARKQSGSTQGNNLRSLLAAAETNLQRAWEFYRARRFRPAVKLANQVENAARKIIDMAGRESRAHTTFEQRHETVRGRIERARYIVAECQSETARQLLEQAQRAYEMARNLANNHQYRASLQVLQNAQAMANRAAEECAGGDSLARKYERMKAEARRLADDVPATDDTGQRLLSMAREQLQLAKKHIDNGDHQAGTAALRAADLTLKQLHKHIGSGTLE